MKKFLKNEKYYPAIFSAALLAFVLSAGHFHSLKKTPGSFYFPYSGKEYKISESSSMKKSRDPDWWLNSGGETIVSENEFSTNLGKLEKDSRWRKLYAKNNARDTDNGYHPQNIFRLVAKNQWQNISQQIYFKIEKINLSKSEYRNDSNGVLLFNRYQDGDNLYYTGIRVDGEAVIKKKIGGKYYTFKEKNVFKNDKKYDRDKNPNLIPENKWIGLKSEVKNLEKGVVGIKLYVDLEDNGNWQLILETRDEKDNYGDKPFEEAGYGGIRTDFMDVKFKDYGISKL